MFITISPETEHFFSNKTSMPVIDNLEFTLPPQYASEAEAETVEKIAAAIKIVLTSNFILMILL